MTIVQAQSFYEQDTKKYDVSKNKELLTWLRKIIKNGYHSFIDVDCLQELIDNIVYWYEMKYPEREMEFYEGTRYFNFEDMKTLSNMMDIKQLKYRLPHKQLCLMECDYRSNGGGIRDVYNDKGQVVGQKTILFMRIDKKEVEYNPFSMASEVPDFLLYADADNGKVAVDYYLKKYVSNNNDITLDELLVVFKEKYANELELTKLEECVYDHNCDVELRRRVLQLVALKLLYSNRTIPERGYERAKRFINEFNKKMNLNLSTEEIDEAINRDYTNGEKDSYWTVEDVAKKEKKPLKKSKGLVKTLLKNRSN